jgi:lipoate-protein ligase A
MPPTAPLGNMSLARRALSSFSQKLADPANKVQSYLSRSRDPYLNLAIEDHILRTSPPDSTVLFLYMNRPCIVIGRNQNPWTEVDLSILHAQHSGIWEPGHTDPPARGNVDLVRRRSGGGTVFHDEGNVNWSIVCPRADFTRDKHAEMVVRALRKLGVERARVNERHDIVLDQGPRTRAAESSDTHTSPYTDEGGPRPLKVSGSAYKLTRARAMHHATTLLASPNLMVIPHYLRSPAKNFIEAKGVESVSSPVGNIGLDVEKFQEKLQAEFATMHGDAGRPTVQIVGEEQLSIPDVKKGYDELLTDDWMWSQTPQFTLKFQPFDGAKLEMNVQHGVIKNLEGYFYSPASYTHIEKIRVALIDQKLQDIGDWNVYLRKHIQPWDKECSLIAKQLNELLPIPKMWRR